MKQHSQSKWPNLNFVAWLLGTFLLATALVGCGDDGKDGENGPPGEVGLSLANVDGIEAHINSVNIDAGKVTVNFTFTNKNGVAITDLNTYSGVDVLGLGIAKLVPQSGKGYKTPQWVSYINKKVSPEAGYIPPGFETKAKMEIQAGIESNCKQECLKNNGNGDYSYTFKQNIASPELIEGLDLVYDPKLTHRVTMEVRIDKDPNKLLNTHYDFIPATGVEATPEQTRTVEFLGPSCLRCHSNDYDHPWAPTLIFHGDRRYAIANCQVCHTSYSGDPETGAPLDFGTMLHDIHKAQYLVVGFNGTVHDYSKLTFPADMYDCRVCHQEGKNSPVDADDFRYLRALPCGSCHVVGVTDRAEIKAQMHDKYIGKVECALCHADKGEQGAAHHFRDAIAKDNARLDYKAALVANSVRLESGVLKFAVSFKDSKGTAQPSPNTDNRLQYSRMRLGFGNQVDFTDGGSRIDLLALVPVSGSNGVYQYETPFSLSVAANVPATAFITTRMCVDAVTEAPVACNTSADQTRNPAVIPGEGVVFDLAGNTGLPARRNVIENSTCANCHDNKFLAKFGPKMTHDGNYSNFEGECQTCHNPAFSRSSGKPFEDSLDFKVLIHALHANKRTGSAAKPITFPENYGDCASCHVKGSLTLTALANVPADVATDASGNQVEYSPITASCLSCHGGRDNQESLLSHVRNNGGVAGGTLGSYQLGSETCAICHGEGKSAGVDIVHPVNFK